MPRKLFIPLHVLLSWKTRVQHDEDRRRFLARRTAEIRTEITAIDEHSSAKQRLEYIVGNIRNRRPPVRGSFAAHIHQFPELSTTERP